MHTENKRFEIYDRIHLFTNFNRITDKLFKS